jgi:hypothetical protein
MGPLQAVIFFGQFWEECGISRIPDPLGVLLTFFPLTPQEELTDLKAGRTLKLKFPEISLGTFWMPVTEMLPVISVMAVRIFLPLWQHIYVNWSFWFKNLKQGVTKIIDEEITSNCSAYQSPLPNEAGTNITLKQQKKNWNCTLINIINFMQVICKTYFLEFIFEMHYLEQ